MADPAGAARARRYRDRVRGGPPRELRPCGTLAARKRHQRASESCPTCWPDRHNATTIETKEADDALKLTSIVGRFLLENADISDDELAIRLIQRYDMTAQQAHTTLTEFYSLLGANETGEAGITKGTGK